MFDIYYQQMWHNYFRLAIYLAWFIYLLKFWFRLRSTRSWTICGLGTDYRFEGKLWRTYNVTFPTLWQTQIYSFSRSVQLVLIPLFSWKLSWNGFMFDPGSHWLRRRNQNLSILQNRFVWNTYLFKTYKERL